MAIIPWWETIQLRDEIVSASGSIDDVQMSLFQALHGSAGHFPLYADATYYGLITHPSQNLVSLLAGIAIRLAAPSSKSASAPAVLRLDQGMGGGKSHGLVGLWHLAAHPQGFGKTEIGLESLKQAQAMIGAPLPQDLNQPRVVVLACDNMTAGVGNPVLDGPAISLHERFLWRLFDGDQALYNQFRPYYADKSKLAEAIRAVERPVLILVDEVMDYIRQLSDSKHSDLATRDMAFLKALTDVINDVPRTAMIVVMISSEKDTMALNSEDLARRTELADQLDRNGKPATVTSNTDFAAILRRRLFRRAPDETLARETAQEFWNLMGGPWQKNVFTSGVVANASEFEAEVGRCYPFHPLLLHLAEQEWSNIAGFQRVRSTIRIFAATAYALAQRAARGEWTPFLIGTGDLPLSDQSVREAVLGSGLIANEKDQTNFRQVAATDVASDDDKRGHARALDLSREAEFSSVNPRAGERMATALFLLSIIGPRNQGAQGATKGELEAAAFVPSKLFGYSDADSVLAELENAETGLVTLETSGTNPQNRRFRLSTRQTLRMLFRAQRAAVSNDDRDNELAALAESLIKPSPFSHAEFLPVTPDEARDKTALDILAAASLDEPRKTRLVVLDPRKFSLLNGLDQETRDGIRAIYGIGENKLPLMWASSLVFAVVNTQRRTTARQIVADYVAWKRLTLLDSVRSDPAAQAEAEKEAGEVKKRAQSAIKSAFQHIVYMTESGGQRQERAIRLEDDAQTALAGEHVWAKLVEYEKALQPGDFTAKALLANMNAGDYGRPLDELRDSFWNSPRMPLLAEGEVALREAIYNAVTDGKLRLVSASGEELACHSKNDISLSISSQRLAHPEEQSPFANETPVAPPVMTAAGSSAPQPVAFTKGTEVTLNFMLNLLLNDQNRDDAFKLFTSMASAMDERANSVQATVRITVPEEDAAFLTQHIEALGGRATKG